MRERIFLLPVSPVLMDYSHELDYAAVNLDGKFLKWLAHCRNVHANTLRELLGEEAGKTYTGDVEISFFEYSPKFISYAEIENNAEIVDSMGGEIVESITEIPTKWFSQLAAQRVECTEIHISEKGVYWTTLEKHGDVTFTSQELGWDDVFTD